MWQVKIIADSISPTGKRIITYELQYPRFIHSELMTHRMLNKNAASSRAIPVSKVIEMVLDNPAMPIHWGKNQPGMQANEQLTGGDLQAVQELWRQISEESAYTASHMTDAGAHKQIVNRILEPFQWMKTVITGTEWANFFWLRCHKDAQPEFQHLANLMKQAYEESIPKLLQPGEWHTPYYEYGYWDDRGGGRDKWCVTLKDALTISMSCCAQVSYRVLDDSIEKARLVVSKLNLDSSDGNPVHSSPSEHQATPMQHGIGVNNFHALSTWEEGVTAYHKELGFMSNNLAGWIQNRSLIKGNVKWK